MRNIALIAHDGRKQEMLEWVKYNWKTLSKHNLYATGTTGSLIEQIYIGEPSKCECIHDGGIEVDYDYTNVKYPFKGKVTKLLSGPVGGDQQIGAMIAEGKIDAVIFFCDNLITQGHWQDVGALTRLGALYPVSFAMNRTTADMILTSPLFDDDKYERIVPKCIEKYVNRSL